MTRTEMAVSITSAGLTLIFVDLIYFAINGYGYHGYSGNYSRASSWRWGNPNVYTDPSNRAGSVNGTSRIGGGPGSGK